MGQLQSLLKLNSSGFEKMKENQTPPCSRKILSDPRSPTVEVCRTPIETVCSHNENTSTPKTGKSFMSLTREPQLMSQRFSPQNGFIGFEICLISICRSISG